MVIHLDATYWRRYLPDANGTDVERLDANGEPTLHRMILERAYFLQLPLGGDFLPKN